MANLDIAKFKQKAYKKKKGLATFLRKAGKTKKRGLAPLIVEADKETWNEVACLDCANCCKKMTPTYTPADIKRISAHVGLSAEEYFKKYLEKRKDGDVTNKKTPCHFLGEDHKCTIYAIRPADCAGFPHFTRKDFKYQAEQKTYTTNITLCPATLVFVEKLEAKVAEKMGKI